MNNVEFKKARKELGLSKEQLSVLINTNIRTVEKWESRKELDSSRRPNPVACVVLGWMLDGFRPPNWPE